MSIQETVNRNIEIKELPLEVDRILNMISAVRGSTKRDIIKLALTEFASNHRSEIKDFEAAFSEAKGNGTK